MNCSNKTDKSVVFMHSNCDSNRDTAVPAEGNGDLQTLICVLVARPRWCPTLSNPVPTKLNGGLSWLHSADEDAVLWLTSYGSWHNALMMMTKMMSKPHIKVTKKTTRIYWHTSNCLTALAPGLTKFQMVSQTSSEKHLIAAWSALVLYRLDAHQTVSNHGIVSANKYQFSTLCFLLQALHQTSGRIMR